MTPQIRRAAAAAPISTQVQPGRPLDSDGFDLVAAAAPAAAAAPGWLALDVDVVGAGVFTVWVSVTVVAGVDAVTVSVRAGPVTVLVVVTVVVFAGVPGVFGVVACIAEGTVAPDAVVRPGVSVSVRVVAGVVAVAVGLVVLAVRAPVRRLARFWPVPEPHAVRTITHMLMGIGAALASLTIQHAHANGLAFLTATTLWETAPRAGCCEARLRGVAVR